MTRSKPERLLLEVAKGALVPGDVYTASRLRARGYRVGDVLLADLRKPRSPGFHRLAHRLGELVAENVEEFAGLNAHQALKRLQVEGNIECDELPVFLSLLGQKIKVNQRIPRSLSFASMDEGRFRETVQAFCRFIAAEYWPSLTPEAIEAMVDVMPESA
jgi:hypothetical protein